MLTALAIILLVAFLLLVPLGLPGTWLMLVVLAVATYAGEVALWTFAALAAVAGVAELAEFVAVKRLSARYGGSGRAFWGAIAGGVLGILVGAPIPVGGSLVAGVVGTFAGAALTAYWEGGEVGAAARVGWGAVLGRALAVGAKVAAGIAILVVGISALIAG